MTVAAMVMWSVWGTFALIMAVLYIYRSSLTRDEEDQIFLDESFDHEKAHQAVIVARVAKVEPLVRIARWLVVAMTAVVVVYYVRDIMLQCTSSVSGPSAELMAALRQAVTRLLALIVQAVPGGWNAAGDRAGCAETFTSEIRADRNRAELALELVEHQALRNTATTRRVITPARARTACLSG